MEQSVFDRFPEKYRVNSRGGPLFRGWGSVSEAHDRWLPENYFLLVGQMTRHASYKNRRAIDPFIEMYYDDNGIEKSAEWGLPVPNEEAAYKSLSKYAKDCPFMDDDQVRDMNRAWEWTSNHFFPYMHDARVRTLEEVVAKLDRTTSAGAPYNVLYSTKGDLLDFDPDILQTFEESWQLLESDPCHTYLCTNSLKEEIRPTEKTAQNKIRTFTAMAVDATVDGNRLFVDMNEKMNSAWLTSSSTVGWSPMNGNWGRLLEKLQIHPNGYALDESEYDSSLRSYMMWGCARFRWCCLQEADRTSENLRRVKTYYRNLVNTVIISPEGVLVMKLGGNPSGSVNTINDNTLILFTLLSYAWIRAVPDKHETSLQEFLSNVSMALCGDDNTWTVSDEAHPFFNGKTVCEEFSSIGIITTSDCYEPRVAEDLDYLSAHTVYLKGFAVPQYNRQKILTSLLYSNRQKHTPANALTRACGMLVCGYTDTVLRKFLREVIGWLLLKFDRVCYDDPEWIVAKTGILSDQRLFDLWTGTSFFLSEQCVQSCTEDTGTKRTMSSQVKSTKSQPKRGEGAKATRNTNEKINFSPEEHEKFKKHIAKGVSKEDARARIVQSRGDKQMVIYASGPPTPKQRKLATQATRTQVVVVNERKQQQAQRAPMRMSFKNAENGEGEKKKKKKDRYGGRTPEWWEKLMDTGSDLVEHFAPMLMGMGDYVDEDVLAKSPEPEANSIMSGASEGKFGGALVKELKSGRSDVPSIHEDGLVTRIAHREYIGDVLSSTALFTALEFALNPGMKETFPWLNQVAANYTQYQFLGLVFEFVSEGSEYTNSAGLGYVAMSTQYDAASAAFVDKRSMLNAQFADAAKPSKSFQQWVECSPDRIRDPRRNIRCAANPANTSINDYDVGKTTLAVGGNVAAGAVIGEFWVSYDVLLYVPRSQGFVNTTIDKYGVISGAATSSDAAMLGSTWSASSGSVNTFAPILTGTSIAFPNGTRGRFFVELQFIRTTTATAASGAYNTTLVGCAVAANTNLTQAPTFVATQVLTIQQQAYEVFSDGASITFANSLAFFGAGTGTTIIFITQIPAGFSDSSPIMDRGGENRLANYEKLMDLITKKEKDQKKILVETDIFRVVLDTENSKLWFYVISDPDTLYFLPYGDLSAVLGQSTEFVDKFLMERLCQGRGGTEITTIRR